jgi:hypothetical protein
LADYTADAVALLCYLVDGLPAESDRLFAEAEAGEIVIQAPGTALTESLYSVSRDKDVRGMTLTGTPEEARQALVVDGPISIAPFAGPEMAEYAVIADDYGIHDAVVVASHHTQDTEAVITTDGVIRDSDVRTVWD